MFILEKVRVLEGCSSLVGMGEIFTGRELTLWKWDDPENRKTLRDVRDVEVGYQVIINNGTYIRTSKIQDVTDMSFDEAVDPWVIFRTETSIYRLREVEDLSDE